VNQSSLTPLDIAADQLVLALPMVVDQLHMLPRVMCCMLLTTAQ
jgi:hypothetical protein